MTQRNDVEIITYKLTLLHTDQIIDNPNSYSIPEIVSFSSNKADYVKPIIKE